MLAGQQEAECVGIEHGVNNGAAQENTGVAFTQECLHFSQLLIEHERRKCRNRGCVAMDAPMTQ